MAANPSIQLGTDGNWAIKEDNLLAYKKDGTRFFNKEFDFTRNTTATFVDKNGLIKESATNTPRIDFTDDPTGHLLLEPQRTNLVPQSNNTTTNNWSHYNYDGGLIVDTYGYPSPNGKNEASRLVYTNSSLGSGGALLTSNITLLATGVYTISLWAKSVSGTKEIRFSPKSTGSAGPAGSRVILTNQWKRYTHTFTNDGGADRGFQFRLSDPEDSGDRTFDVWGMTIEEGSYATSYIPTNGSAVTRNAEICNNSGTVNDFNSEEGVLYAEIAALADEGHQHISLSDGSISNRVTIELYPSPNIIVTRLVSNNVQQCFLIALNINKENYNKIAIKYKENDCSLWINGIEVETDITATMPSGLSELAFDYGDNNSTFYGKTKNLKVFKRALTDAELQELTT